MSDKDPETKDEIKEAKENSSDAPFQPQLEVRQSALARQLSRRKDRPEITEIGAQLGKLLAVRPTKEKLQSQGVIKPGKLDKHAAIAESLKTNQRKDKLNSLFGTRSDRKSLVARGILVTINEGDTGLSKEKAAQKLGSLIGSRPAPSDLQKRGILKSIGEGDEKKARIAKLGTLLEGRETKNNLERKNILNSEKAPKADHKTTLNQLILARPKRTTLESRGVFRSREQDRARKKNFGIRKMSLSTLMAHRPNPKALVEQKIIADIGDLPSMNFKKHGNQLLPKPVDSLKDTKLSSVCSGWGHTIAVDEKGFGHVFGSGSNGRLGLGEDSVDNINTPTINKTLQDLGSITKVVTGDHHSAAIVDGKLYTWGSGNWGMCGHGNKNDAFIPTEVPFDSTVLDVACGTYHTIVLTEGNQVYAFGWNKNGRLGTGKKGPLTALEPILISSLTAEMKIGSLYANLGMSIALTEDGKAYSWGNGSFGGTGHGDDEDQWEPKLIEALNDQEIIQASIGANFGHALTKKGRIYSWGQGRSGQLGRPYEKKGVEGPTVIEGVENIVSIGSGNNHSFATDQNGVLFAWGQGKRGVLGTGSEENVLEPKAVDGLKGVKIISVTGSFGHSGAVSKDGQLFTWGSSQHGKLGYDYSG